MTIVPEIKNCLLSVIIPCYNEEKTLEKCVRKVLAIEESWLKLEIIIVDDASSDKSREVISNLMKKYPSSVHSLAHDKNQGKGAALSTGFRKATGDFVCIQDADLEYNPDELKYLVKPLMEGIADVVIGSRFVSTVPHRVLYFWHSLGNRFLTLLSNMLTDLNITDMETCYKLFRREVIQNIELKEKRFGFEPEIIAKVAQKRLRIYEMGISYQGRTYQEGKKIGLKDGFRALYCICKYNLPRVPWPIQFLFYTIIGGICAGLNLILFLSLHCAGLSIVVSAAIAFIVAATANYFLSITIVFRHKARWNSFAELSLFGGLVCCIGYVDIITTQFFIKLLFHPAIAKLSASIIGLFLNFIGRKWCVFPEAPNKEWKPQETN
jgi:glycosyltransferase involved in cell wall biosynthesis